MKRCENIVEGLMVILRELEHRSLIHTNSTNIQNARTIRVKYYLYAIIIVVGQEAELGGKTSTTTPMNHNGRQKIIKNQIE